MAVLKSIVYSLLECQFVLSTYASPLSSPYFPHAVMIGDGVTDMQAKPPAQLFIGFGGVVTREAVRTGADLFVTDFKVIEDMLDR